MDPAKAAIQIDSRRLMLMQGQEKHLRRQKKELRDALESYQDVVDMTERIILEMLAKPTSKNTREQKGLARPRPARGEPERGASVLESA